MNLVTSWSAKDFNYLNKLVNSWFSREKWLS